MIFIKPENQRSLAVEDAKDSIMDISFTTAISGAIGKSSTDDVAEGSGICFVGNGEPIILSQFTSQKNQDSIGIRKDTPEPLTEEELDRLSMLKEKVDSNGSPSVLTEEELSDYEQLGIRYNLMNAGANGVMLPTAVRPWITAATKTPDLPEEKGECYRNAGSMMLNGDLPSWVLVHGRPTRPTDGIEHGHAWLESPDGQVVIDPSYEWLGRAEDYYEKGKIKREDNFYYTAEEATEKMLEFNHFGPWEGVDAEPPAEIDYSDEEWD